MQYRHVCKGFSSFRCVIPNVMMLNVQDKNNQNIDNLTTCAKQKNDVLITYSNTYKSTKTPLKKALNHSYTKTRTIYQR